MVDGNAVPGLAIPGGTSPGLPELTMTYTYIGLVPVTYLNYFGSSGVLTATRGTSFTVAASFLATPSISAPMGASGSPYPLSFPPADGKWMINGVLYPFVPVKQRVVMSRFSIHDEWCNGCLQRHWQYECPPDPRAELAAARAQAQRAAMM